MAFDFGLARFAFAFRADLRFFAGFTRSGSALPPVERFHSS
ncbi:MAG: hypothetical protein Q7R30_00675 [Acidobacteriota bacterium]|nr:hypothetical protein [Acidobacteriota bacterium]